MEQIEIIKRDGTVIKCFCPEPFCTPTQAVQEKSLMSDDTVKITLRTTEPYLFSKGDRVVIDGETYKIRTTQERQLQTEDDYVHTLTFYGVMYDLMKCQYRNCDANGNSTKAIFDLTYSIKDFVKVAIYNLNRDNPGEWAFDEQNCPDTEPITVSFSKSNVLQVIQDLCSKDKFNLEFRITTANGVNTIHIGQFGSVVTPPSGAAYFEYGKGNGLWQLKEKKVDDKAVITRLWAEGGTQNIKSGYRDYSDRLQLPYPQRVNRNRHVLKDGTLIEAETQIIGITDDSKRYLEDEAMSQAIGVEEDTQTFDDVYPKRTGTVTALGGSVLEFVDNTMDFDLNEKDSEGNTKYLIDGTSAKLTFITGKLAGQEFELSKYDHATKMFKLIAYTDERGLKIPTEDTDAFCFVVGDKYKLTDINMPDSYVQNAEEDLWYKALEYFNEAKQARCQYELTFDREYFLENMTGDSETCMFKVGDYVPIKDNRFGIEKNIRIQKVSRNLLLEHDYTLTLSDTTAISVVAQSVLDVIEHEKIIQINDLRNLTKAKRGWRTTEELRNMVYDTDGYFDNENIRPNSIDTNMLTVGSKSQQFVLSGVVLAANVGGNPNNFMASSGILSHLTIQEDGVRVWNMAAQDVTLSQPGGYYVFAKCSKTGSNGVWFVTQEQLKVEPASDPNNYYFQVGIIGSLAEGGTFRDFTSTYGFTRINGNTITTGRIVTADGESYLDLDGNLFRIGDSYSSVTLSNSGNRKKVTLKNVDVVSGAGDPVALGVPRGAFDSNYTYYPNDTVQYTVGTSTATYRYINPNPSKGHLPTDSTYWAIEAKGADGGQGASAYFHIKYAAVSNPTDAQMKDTPDKYIGTCTDTIPTAPTTASSYTWAQFRGQDGTSITISSREIKYVRSADGVNAPGSSAAWQTSIPPEDPNKPYLWTRTEVTYSDQLSTTSYGVSRVGKDGSSVTITSREIKYAKGTDGSTIPTTWKNWGEITFEAGDYMWTRTTVTYSDELGTVAYSVSRIGADGERGYPGEPGEDGRTTYLHIKYSKDGGLTFTDNNGETPGSYMGQYTDFEEWDSSNPADYTWALIEGASGVGGADGEVEPYYEFRFAKNGSRLTPPALDQTNPDPTGWSTVQPSVAALEYLWQIVAQKTALGQKALFHIPINSGESGTLADASGHGKNIALGSGSVVASVGDRTALSMPGNALATMVNLLPFGENFTLCFWVRTEQSYIDWCLNGKWGVSSVEKRLSMGQNVWTHVALRFTEKSLTVFKDGALVDTANLSERVVGFSMWDDNMFGSAIYLDDIWCLSGALADADIVKVKDGNTDALVTAWSTPVRITPYDGEDGKSPVFTYRGDWKNNVQYIGTDVMVQGVKYNGVYYVSRTDAGNIPVGTLPTNTNYWNTFGAQFESVATELLLAEYANIGNLVLHNNCIMSTKGTINGVESDDYTNPNFVPNIIIDGQNGNSVISGSLRNPFTLFRKYQFKASGDSRTYYRYSNGDSNGRYAWVFYTNNGSLYLVYTTTETPYNGAAYYASSVTTTQAGVCLECKAVNVFSGDVANGLSRSDNVVMPYSATSDRVLTSDEFSWTPDNSGRLIRLVNYKWGSSIASKYVYLSAPDGKYFYENGKQFSRIRLSRETVELLGYGTPTVFYGWIVVNRVDTLTEGTYGSPLKVICQGIFNPSSTYLVDKVWTSDQDVDGYDDDWIVQIITNGHYKVWLPFNIPVDEWHVMLTPCSVGSDGSRITYGNIPGNGCCYACLYAKGIDTSKGLAYFEVKTADDASLNDCGFLFQVIPTNNWAKPGDKTKSGVSQIERTSTGFHNVTVIRET